MVIRFKNAVIDISKSVCMWNDNYRVCIDTGSNKYSIYMYEGADMLYDNLISAFHNEFLFDELFFDLLVSDSIEGD